MFSWLGGKKSAASAWNVAPSPNHTYVVSANADLATIVAPALAELDASLATASRELRADLAGDDPGDGSLLDAFDDDGKLRALIADDVSVEPVASRAQVNATDAVIVRLRTPDRVDALVPYALVAVASALARSASGSVYDTLGGRVLPDDLVAEPLAGLPIGSAGPHVTIVPSTGAGTGDTRRFTTVGLAKYCLFEVTLDGVPAAVPRASEIVAAFVQSMIAPMPPLVAGPRKPGIEYVNAAGVRAFFDTDGPDAKKSLFTALRARPGTDPAAPWTIVDERTRPLGAPKIAAILETFDAERAAAAT